MAPTPLRIAQTSSEAKKQYKKSGPRLPERQQKQLERAHELDVRAARLREAEDRRRAARKRREEREAKEKAARQQSGVGLATQLIGYSHTQAQLKSGMEAFLGVKKRSETEQRKRDTVPSRQPEPLARQADKEPWDDDDDDNHKIAPPVAQLKVSFGEQFADDDLDDDSLLQAHDMVVSDPSEPHHARLRQSQHPHSAGVASSKLTSTKEDPDFLRLHGPVHKAAESILEKMPEPLIELLSQDISLKMPAWNPPPGLLHKLNPLGLPPHRLRIKVGCFVTLLCNLDLTNRLSKGQRLQVLRIEDDRLECLVLGGQQGPTKAFLTRIAFAANYRNDDAHRFERIQFPIRLTTDHEAQPAKRTISQPGFEPPLISGKNKMPKPSVGSEIPTSKWNLKLPVNHNDFRRPGIPASKSKSSSALDPGTPPANEDNWDDFFDSGTQIARELSSEGLVSVVASQSAAGPSNSISECLPPLSTQDLDFSLDDLDETSLADLKSSNLFGPDSTSDTPRPVSGLIAPASNTLPIHSVTNQTPTPLVVSLPNAARMQAMTSKSRSHLPKRAISPINLDAIRPSQRPLSVSDRPGLKRRAFLPPSPSRSSLAKRHSMQLSTSIPHRSESKTDTRSHGRGITGDTGIPAQEATFLFADEEDMVFGSPPIAV